ncbi:MAG TPA: hypothetical protein VHZ55_00455 [Bryobacteraceae bacterium]|nr:hypothetical protein [Bryobacteraceae bacterium]
MPSRTKEGFSATFDSASSFIVRLGGLAVIFFGPINFVVAMVESYIIVAAAVSTSANNA